MARPCADPRGASHARLISSKEEFVNALILFVGWCILLVVAWPVALLALLLFPLVWLITLPFRLLGIALEGVFALLRAIVLLPARVLGHRG
jgi:hypothetical protein